MIALIAALSMVLGNLVAIVQSSEAVAGLLGDCARRLHAARVMAHDEQAIVSVVYYATTLRFGDHRCIRRSGVVGE